jgi:hypothetical protein
LHYFLYRFSLLLTAIDVVFEGSMDQFIGIGAPRQTFSCVTLRFVCCGETFAADEKASS